MSRACLAAASNGNHAYSTYFQMKVLAVQDGASAASTGASDAYFVSVDGDGDFAIGCTKFFFSGWNQQVLFAPCSPPAHLLHGTPAPQIFLLRLHL